MSLKQKDDKKNNNLLLHEINPITSILPDGKIFIAAEHLGISYTEFINEKKPDGKIIRIKIL